MRSFIDSSGSRMPHRESNSMAHAIIPSHMGCCEAARPRTPRGNVQAAASALFVRFAARARWPNVSCWAPGSGCAVSLEAGAGPPTATSGASDSRKGAPPAVRDDAGAGSAAGAELAATSLSRMRLSAAPLVHYANSASISSVKRTFLSFTSDRSCST